MHLTRLISYSECKGTLNRETLQHILFAARDHNKRDEITGLLCYNEKYFLQVLEGARALLSATFQRIAANDAHCNLVIVSCQSIYDRAFPNWWMAYVDNAESMAHLSLKYSGTSEFRPDLMPADSLLLFAKDLGLTVQAGNSPTYREIVYI